MAGEKGGGSPGDLDCARGSPLPCEGGWPPNPQPSLRAVAHHLIRLHELRAVLLA
jgi:hypothetical protein